MCLSERCDCNSTAGYEIEIKPNGKYCTKSLGESESGLFHLKPFVIGTKSLSKKHTFHKVCMIYSQLIISFSGQPCNDGGDCGLHNSICMSGRCACNTVAGFEDSNGDISKGTCTKSLGRFHYHFQINI